MNWLWEVSHSLLSSASRFQGIFLFWSSVSNCNLTGREAEAMRDSRDMWCRLTGARHPHVVTQTNTLASICFKRAVRATRRKPFSAEKTNSSGRVCVCVCVCVCVFFFFFYALVSSPNRITENSAHYLYAHKPISAGKNWGVKGVNSRVDLYCKWMGHFQKTQGRRRLDARQAPSGGEVVHQGSLFNYELSSRGRKKKKKNVRQFNSRLIDWVWALEVLRVCVRTVCECVCVCVCVCVCERVRLDR